METSRCAPPALTCSGFTVVRSGIDPLTSADNFRDDQWQDWTGCSTARPDEKRLEALRRIRESLLHHPDTLNLAGLGLTSLPNIFLPPDIIHLNLAFNRLETLPPILPTALQTLNASNNRLAYALTHLPGTLRQLDLSYNQLLELFHLPSSLATLNVAHNRLRGLPPMPASLSELNVCGNLMRELPTALPRNLLRLDASSNNLTSLPDDLPSQLAELDLRHNFLASVPAAVLRLPRWAVVRMENNAIATSTHLRPPEERRNAPHVYLTAAPAGQPDVESRPLHQAVERWLSGARRPVPATAWQKLDGERHARHFSAFLDALGNIRSRHEDYAFNKQLARWLEQLTRLPDLRAETFAIAQGATQSCEDRVALTYNQMQHAWRAHRVQVGKLDNDLPKVIALARQLFRLEHLGRIACAKMATLTDPDEIEVMLAYQVKLRTALGLRHGVENMRFYAVSEVTRQDLEQAEQDVKLAENQQFSAWLLGWRPWKSILQRIAPEPSAAASKILAELVEGGEFERRLAQRLAADQLQDVPDASVIVGKLIMDEMRQASDEALAVDVLGHEQCDALLAPYWQPADIPSAPAASQT